jgi:hypothetical protein
MRSDLQQAALELDGGCMGPMGPEKNHADLSKLTSNNSP